MEMMMQFKTGKAIILILVCLGMIACSTNIQQEDKPPPKRELVKAKTIEEIDNPVQSDDEINGFEYSAEAALEDWPDDVPLMEPYTIKWFPPEWKGFRQISIIVNTGWEAAYDFYSEQLFIVHGWEADADSKMGIPDLMISFKCFKDHRELNIMMKKEGEGEETLIQLKLTDLDKYESPTR